MHETPAIVGQAEGQASPRDPEVALQPGDDVSHVDLDEVVPVRPTLLVEEAEGVPQFVPEHTVFEAVLVGDVQVLDAVLDEGAGGDVADVGGAAAGAGYHPEAHVGGVGGRLLPMCCW